MATVYVKQVISGKTVRSFSVDDTLLNNLSSLLMGRLDVYKLDLEDGAPSPITLPLNAKKISVGKKENGYYMSATVSIPHVRPSVQEHEVRDAAKANLNPGYNASGRPTYCNLLVDAR